MQALKVLVIVMGVLIVIGTAVVVVTIYNRVTGMAENRDDATDPVAAGGAPVPSEPPAGFGEAALPLPEGCRVAETTADAGRLLLRLAGEAGRCRRILVVDLQTGALLGSIDLAPQP